MNWVPRAIISHPYVHGAFAGFLKIFGIYRLGYRNALKITCRDLEIALPRLPKEWDGKQLLFMADLHIDGMPELLEPLCELLQRTPVEACLLGGDYRFEFGGEEVAPALEKMRQVLSAVKARHGTFAVRGNHDIPAMVTGLEKLAVQFLHNRNVVLGDRDSAKGRLVIAGVDDPHFFKRDDLAAALRGTGNHDTRILLAHCPELFGQAAAAGVDLYLCGHTHQGQIRLPKWGPIFTQCWAPRRLASGIWREGAMQGYTTAGVGTAGTRVRFGCPPEIVRLTLRQKSGN